MAALRTLTSTSELTTRSRMAWDQLLGKSSVRSRLLETNMAAWLVVPLRLSWLPILPAISSRTGQSYEQASRSALPIVSNAADRGTIEILYRPFVKPLVDKNGRETSNWLVWAAKFWHHLNPLAFPIEDSRVDDFFALTGDSASVDKYMKLLERFRTFVLSHLDWLPQLRHADGGVDGEVDGVPVCSDNKFWDKMIYGLGDLDRAGE
jgi:hypothetical protein